MAGFQVFAEQAHQAELEQRIQSIEQTFARLRGKLDGELSSLRSHVQILQDQLDSLLKLRVDLVSNKSINETSVTGNH